MTEHTHPQMFYILNTQQPFCFHIPFFLPSSQTSTSTGLAKGVSAQCLFDLLVSLEGETHDALDALELVKAEKPLRSLGKLSFSHTHYGP